MVSRMSLSSLSSLSSRVGQERQDSSDAPDSEDSQDTQDTNSILNLEYRLTNERSRTPGSNENDKSGTSKSPER